MTLQAYLAIWLGGVLMLCLDPTWAWPLQLFYVVEAGYLLRAHRDHQRPGVIDPNDLGPLGRHSEQV